MKVIVVIQARTNSSRLPGKVLLPICGLPIAVLAAKRAEGGDKKVIVVTSTESTDDYLADVLSQYNINLFRGSLDNVLKRYCDCLSEYVDNTVIVRLTADNVFPCSKLIDELVSEYINTELDYLCLNGESSGLPYGVSAEVMKLGGLRDALNKTDDAFDLEHVTPYIRRKYGDKYYKKYLSLDLGMYRCTIDSFSDYIDVVNIFKHVDNPVTTPLWELLRTLKDSTPLLSRKNKNLILGTAQLGLSYGIANKRGQPSKSKSFSLLSDAVKNGMQYLDTASAYGNSESIIGEWLSTGWKGRVRIITKLSPLPTLKEEASLHEVKQKVDESIYQSLVSLQLTNLDIVMLHRADHLTACGGAILEHLRALKEEGKISVLGGSVQSPSELISMLKYPDIEYIQLPFNILDSRWKVAIQKLVEEKELRVINVHVRSIYLQGLLLTDEKALWNKANVIAPEPIIEWLNKKVAEYNSGSINKLCMNYVISQPWVDALVIGVDDELQLQEALQGISQECFSTESLDRIAIEQPKLNNDTLNPSLWKKYL